MILVTMSLMFAVIPTPTMHANGNATIGMVYKKALIRMRLPIYVNLIYVALSHMCHARFLEKTVDLRANNVIREDGAMARKVTGLVQPTRPAVGVGAGIKSLAMNLIAGVLFIILH